LVFCLNYLKQSIKIKIYIFLSVATIQSILDFNVASKSEIDRTVIKTKIPEQAKILPKSEGVSLSIE